MDETKKTVESSILITVKEALGIDSLYTPFDPTLIMHINSAFMELYQLGAGPNTGYSIKDDSADWKDFMDDGPLLNIIKTFIYLKTRLLFDPPSSSTIMDSINRAISECEWRILEECEVNNDET